KIELATANSLWGQRGERWRHTFLDGLARDYGAGMHVVDYERDAEGARQAINDWTAHRTRGRIPELVPAGILDLLTRLVLVNAVYLKAPWEKPFQRRDTRPGWFTLDDGSRVKVPMMADQELYAGYTEGSGWRA